MAYRVLLRLDAVRGAGFPLRPLQDLAPDEQRVGTSDEPEQEAFGWHLAGRLEEEPRRERFCTWTAWEVVAEIVETDLVEAIG